MIRAGILRLAVLGLATMSYGQEPAAPKGTAPAATAAASGAPAIPGGTDVLATVTSRDQTDKVTKADVILLLSRYPLPPAEEREAVYSQALELVINNRLLNHYLVSQRVQVPESTIDQQIEGYKQQLKREGQDLATMLLQSDKSMDDLRKEFSQRLRFPEYANKQATDATLKNYLRDQRDLFSGTQVRASHILLKFEPTANKEEKEKVKRRLEAIRKEIVSVKISFAAAANKYSEDPANAGGAGGDLDYFTLNQGFVEEFAEAAFKLKKGEISEPVETPFGFHLIQVTDRKEGKLPEFEQIKPYVLNAYMAELQKKIVTEERQTAKIDQKPMPKDFFPSAPSAAAAVAPGTPAASPAAGGAVAPKP
jgi:parvulin-like peptidyl-prolyl isomerase